MVTIINQPSVQKDGFLAAVLPDVIKNDGTPQTYYFGEQLAKKSSSVFVKNG